jgi:hypothetical protein
MSITNGLWSKLLSSTLVGRSSALLNTGCVRRKLTIRSEPPGALILMNEEKIGTTPYSYDFDWYGSYRLTLMKDGYNRLDDTVTLQAPWYMWIPLDFAMEVLPFPVRDTRSVSYTLQEKQPLPIPVPPTAQEPATTPEEADGDAG